MENKKLKVALLLGGTSPEKEVSRNSAKSILKALRDLNHEVIPIDPALGLNQPENENDLFKDQDSNKLSNRNYLEIINSKIFDDIDVAFIALHGKYGEDGTIQSLLEMRGIKYTGSNVLTNALAMNKLMTKIVLEYNGVKTAEWVSAEKKYDLNEIKKYINEKIFYPCVVKPNDQGSSVGLTFCENENQLKDAIELALQFSDVALIEKYIAGKELTVSILNDKPLPVVEIKPKSGFYDYKSKYTSGLSEYVCPAEISDEVAKHLQEQALKAYKAVGCKTYSRIDFRLNDNNESFCLEINTLPGMTNLSLVPKAANAAGITFEQLIENILMSALE
ncbi:MAG: D-alanine--D-alanine ligase [Melioribacteraceae bacterium]|nr:D-alanine--D-alanine ligase [Melioribacteraceae bacterium]